MQMPQQNRNPSALRLTPIHTAVRSASVIVPLILKGDLPKGKSIEELGRVIFQISCTPLTADRQVSCAAIPSSGGWNGMSPWMGL
jgi:hypothetical protein